MVIFYCRKCRMPDLGDENEQKNCMICHSPMLSLGISSAEWNKLGKEGMDRIIEEKVAEADGLEPNAAVSSALEEMTAAETSVPEEPIQSDEPAISLEKNPSEETITAEETQAVPEEVRTEQAPPVMMPSPQMQKAGGVPRKKVIGGTADASANAGSGMRVAKRTYDLSAHISDINCSVTTENAVSTANIGFFNKGNKTVTAVKFEAQGFNAFGDIVPVGGKEKFFLVIQDISVDRDESARGLKAVLPDPDIKKLELSEAQVCYIDGSVVSYEGEEKFDVELLEYDVYANREILPALRDRFGDSFRYKPHEFEKGWICGCGNFNKTGTTVCARCNCNKSELFKYTAPGEEAGLIKEYRANEEIRAQERTAAEKRERRERSFKSLRLAFTVIAVLGVIVLLLVAAVNSGRKSEKKKKTDYSSSYLTSTYTSPSYKSYKYDYSDYSYENGARVLKVKDINLSTNTGYTICTGTVKNTGTKTYTFVKVKGAFEDVTGKVVDTDWTYAAGEEGLAPGESTTFRLSVTKDSKIKSCDVTVFDYD